LTFKNFNDPVPPGYMIFMSRDANHSNSLLQVAVMLKI